MDIKIIIFLLCGFIAFGLNIYVKFLLNRNRFNITYMNTFIKEFILFSKLIKRSSTKDKNKYIIILVITVLSYILLLTSFIYIIIAKLYLV
jgi:hypothetical protein